MALQMGNTKANDAWSMCTFGKLYKYVWIPEAPDPSYGNTRPSVHDTPGALKQVATWHPMTSHGAIGMYEWYV